jgi:hypothetical protein
MGSPGWRFRRIFGNVLKHHTLRAANYDEIETLAN